MEATLPESGHGDQISARGVLDAQMRERRFGTGYLHFRDHEALAMTVLSEQRARWCTGSIKIRCSSRDRTVIRQDLALGAHRLNRPLSGALALRLGRQTAGNRISPACVSTSLDVWHRACFSELHATYKFDSRRTASRCKGGWQGEDRRMTRAHVQHAIYDDLVRGRNAVS